MAKGLDKGVLELLLKKAGLKSEASVRVRISELRRKFSGLTLNAAAQLYAERFGKSIMFKLDPEDRQSLYQAKIQAMPQKTIYIKKERKRPSKPFEYLKYPSKDKFEQKHVEEINKAYDGGCYTAVYVLCRKVIENLIIKLLRKRFGGKEIALYWDKPRGRFHDFKIILKKLNLKANQFPGPIQTAVRRLVSKATIFAKDANDKTHSLFHIATKKELDEANIDEIFELIILIDKEITA
jgi:hypothetical protein